MRLHYHMHTQPLALAFESLLLLFLDAVVALKASREKVLKKKPSPLLTQHTHTIMPPDCHPEEARKEEPRCMHTACLPWPLP